MVITMMISLFLCYSYGGLHSVMRTAGLLLLLYWFFMCKKENNTTEFWSRYRLCLSRVYFFSLSWMTTEERRR